MIERAYELAKTGQFAKASDIVKRLRTEGYENPAGRIVGKALKLTLLNECRIALGKSTIAESARMSAARRRKNPARPSKDIFDPSNTRGTPLVLLDGTIEWPRGWTKVDAQKWRKANKKL